MPPDSRRFPGQLETPEPCPWVVSKFQKVKVMSSFGKGGIWSLAAGWLGHPLIPSIRLRLHLQLPCHTCGHNHHFVIPCSIRTWKATGTYRTVYTLQAWTLCRQSHSVVCQAQDSVSELQGPCGLKLLPFFPGFYHLPSILLGKQGAQSFPLELDKLLTTRLTSTSTSPHHPVVHARRCTHVHTHTHTLLRSIS